MARESLNLGVREFAVELATVMNSPPHYVTLNKWEGEDYTGGGPRAEYLAAIVELCNVSPEWLLLGTGPMKWSRDEQRAHDKRVVADWLHRTAEYLEAEAADLERQTLLRLEPGPFAKKEDGSDGVENGGD